ncbi:MAG: Nucleotidyltransferase substrate binding protein, HI0074 family [candidate division TM6 bacterium GW2011_GWE2_42_60]|nr:MAG: Nucleotidyltransferase substrate binding protein, HI0074 family [candidate division TM6 bacterium GW2011_GWE2_42_60]HBY05428.1 hypothetical protein [Candidatus Dependentiae bacterium]
MGKLILAKENIKMALVRLGEALEDFDKVSHMRAEDLQDTFDRERLERSLRDSLIQRFEFCIELFWKYLKRYEEEVHALVLEVSAPRSVIAAACKAKIISERDAEVLLEMLTSRNFTSHLYKAEVAERISAKIPEYYQLMAKYIEAL